MQLQFDKQSCRCLQQIKRNQQNQEQTQELRLPDGMPDVGSILASWGQVLLRSKEWRGGGMSVSGGVMAWVLYAPEGGGEPQCVESWIPFQMKWDFEDTQRDGTIQVHCFLRSLDARSASARKLVLRANVGVLAEATLPSEMTVYTPGQLPEDIQILKKTYPVRLPKEAGEKSFTLEEELLLPPSVPAMQKLLAYQMQPELLDRKIMAGKVVFRGVGQVHIVYLGEDGCVHSWDFEIPFSQYGDLDGEYDQDATARILPVLTAMEMEHTPEGKLNLKCGLAMQYKIYCREMLDLVEDAYSTNRVITPQWEQLQLPALLDTCEQNLQAEQTVAAEGNQIADVVCYYDHAAVTSGDGSSEIAADGYFQLLYYDGQGELKCVMPRWETQWNLMMDESSTVQTMLLPTGKPQASLGGGNATMWAETLTDTVVLSAVGMPMVCGLEIGDKTVQDAERPSLILCKAGTGGLWDVAKRCGSTVSAIQKANRLEKEPDPEQILLIPIA